MNINWGILFSLVFLFGFAFFSWEWMPLWASLIGIGLSIVALIISMMVSAAKTAWDLE